ncbi:hypothetical protein NDU88_004048 [Pleurodeles waltl]|uniref:Uncharacterized protein n=1 Tax=Pleurodeles waltl TaxID=8319 RepID=A0AAV7V467_PLEWA|nr:hypothetical protein NDU88_004048 [Pleurodeles waltl]
MEHRCSCKATTKISAPVADHQRSGPTAEQSGCGTKTASRSCRTACTDHCLNQTEGDPRAAAPVVGHLHECSGKRKALRRRAWRAHEAAAPSPERVRRGAAVGTRSRRSRALSGPIPRKRGEAQGHGSPGPEEEVRRIATTGVVGHW